MPLSDVPTVHEWRARIPRSELRAIDRLMVGEQFLEAMSRMCAYLTDREYAEFKQALKQAHAHREALSQAPAARPKADGGVDAAV